MTPKIAVRNHTFEYDGRKDGAEGEAAESSPFEVPFRTGGEGDLLDRRGWKRLLLIVVMMLFSCFQIGLS